MTRRLMLQVGLGTPIVLVLLGPLGLFAPLDALLALLVGWPFYLARVVPEVRLNPSGLATGAFCLLGFAVGAHAFLSWLDRSVRAPEPGRWRKKWTALLVLAILLMFTAGLAAAGVAHQVGWMVAAPRRLLLDYPSNLVRRIESANNLKRIGLGAIEYGRPRDLISPPGASATDRGEILHSWQALILPWIDRQAVADRIDLDRPWDDPSNAAALHEVLPAYQIPGVEPERDALGLGLSHYEGNARVVGRFQGLRLLDVPDGLSATILAGESAGGYRPWGEPGHWRDPADGINRDPDKGLGGPLPGGANVLMLDGSVKFLRNRIDPSVLKALSTPDGGESIHPDAY